MQLQSLGYVGVRTGDVDQWATYATRFLGMQLVDQSRGTRAFRMDDRKQRLIVNADAGEGIGFYGWEVADAAALDALSSHLEKSAVAVARGSAALAAERRVADLIVFHDPLGNRLEVFHGAETATEPFRLTPFRVKERELARLGIDLLFVQHFDAAFAARSAESFVEDVLLRAIGVSRVGASTESRSRSASSV